MQIRSCVLVADEYQENIAKNAGVDIIYIDVSFYPKSPIASKNIVYMLGDITHESDYDFFSQYLKPGFNIMVSNLSLLGSASQATLFTEEKIGRTIEVGSNFGVLNSESCKALKTFGTNLIWLSPELSKEEIATITSCSDIDFGMVVAGNQELMVSKYDLGMDSNKSEKLIDRMGYELIIKTDIFNRMHIFNPVSLDILFESFELLNMGVSKLMLDIRSAHKSSTANEVDDFVSAIDSAKMNHEIARRKETTTTGRYFRGVL